MLFINVYIINECSNKSNCLKQAETDQANKQVGLDLKNKLTGFSAYFSLFVVFFNLLIKIVEKINQ